jgi:DNA-binding NarL/FixJ family response regulator
MPRVLLVEDNVLVATDLMRRLKQAGFNVIGPAACLADALALLTKSTCDAAILDFQFSGTQASDSIARELQARNVPYTTVAAYSHRDCPPAFGSPMFAGSVQIATLLAECRRLKSCGHTRESAE